MLTTTELYNLRIHGIIPDNLSKNSYGAFIESDSDKMWKSGEIKLRSIRKTINIHPNIRFKDSGIDYLLGLQNNFFNNESIRLGECRPKFKNGNLIGIEIVRKSGLNQFLTEFTRGHEEGHAMIIMGNMCSLYEEAKKLKLRFDFLKENDAIISDLSANKLMSYEGDNNDIEIAWKKEFILGESLANVGGLISIIKSNSDNNLINEVKRRIENMDENPISHLLN